MEQCSKAAVRSLYCLRRLCLALPSVFGRARRSPTALATSEQLLLGLVRRPVPLVAVRCPLLPRAVTIQLHVSQAKQRHGLRQRPGETQPPESLSR